LENDMKRSFLTFLGITSAQFLAAVAMAQPPSPAEGVAPGSPPPAPYVKASPDQKAEGKAMRISEGSAAAKADSPGEGNPVPTAASKVSKADRQAARVARKAETTRENRAGEITSKGETGTLK
jgi:hypothetical protein